MLTFIINLLHQETGRRFSLYAGVFFPKKDFFLVFYTTGKKGGIFHCGIITVAIRGMLYVKPLLNSLKHPA